MNMLMLLPWALASEQALAILVDNQTLTLTAADAPDTYDLVNGAVLTTQDASTLSIRVTASTVQLNGGTISGGSSNGLHLFGSNATVNGAVVSSTGAVGMAIARVGAAPSTATVSNSTITGARLGAQVSARSTLNISGTTVTGSNADGIGLAILGGTVTATSGTQFNGTAAGVRIGRESAINSQAPTLTLDNSSATGGTGPAVLVRTDTVAEINVRNGSTLNGGNGVILEVQGPATANLNVAASSLRGNVQIADTATANLKLDQASLVGDVVVTPGANASLALDNRSQLTGNLNGVQQVNINSNSNWTLNANNTIGDLAMTGGRITFGDENSFYELNVQSLSGNGEFYMASNFASGATDFLNVTGNASGTHGLMVGTSGTDPASVERLQLVHTGSGDAQFSLLNDRQEVDLGAYSYKLVKDGQDWYLDRETRTISPMTRTVMALFNTPITIAYGEMTSLRSRMGELRYNQGKNAGVWMRAYGNQHNIADASSGVGYQQNQRGLTFGADAQLGESNWTLGLLAGHSRSDLNLSYGSSGSIDSYYVGGYATWMDPESGYYVDSVLKYNRYQNDAKVGLSDGTRTKGDYDTHGMSASVEVGKHIKLDDGYFIEPFAQVAAAAVAGKDFTLDNGFDANGDVSRSLLGKVGTTLGKTISLGGDSMIQPYVKAAFAHEFAQRNQVQVNNNVFNNDLSGSRAELGAGVAWTVAKDFQVYGEAGYMNGKNIEMPYSFSLGASYRF
ncbi:autotransporter outer membrane beta-barrel domain-containing protein [Pseudomonas qingdaonensis]|uniref:Autotransporter outer membrane beta-barrel domain-containing protein n=1 Tax=Pseudomonas qingdaonensis TaxID=2056231 RepID=A0ABX8DRB4_9PSED|nr:autotransporter outer membrane beta-barrel domain-containing protein [Pseudomonas qingdaonensis]